MKRSKKVISAALAIIMSTAVLPVDMMFNTNVVEAREENPVSSKMDYFKKNLSEGTAKFKKNTAQITEEGKKLSDFSNIMASQQNEIKDNVAKFFIGAKTEDEVEKSKINAQNSMGKILKTSVQSVISNLEFKKMQLNNGKYEADKALEEADNLIKNMSFGKRAGTESDIKKYIGYEEFKKAHDKLVEAINKTIMGIEGIESKINSSELAAYTNKVINDTAEDKKAALKAKSNLSESQKKEAQNIIDKIKSADSFNEIDNINIPNYLMFNDGILKAKSDRRQEITDGIDNKYSNYKTEDELSVKNIHIREDEENRSKWIVEGSISNHIRESVSIYYEGRYVGSGVTDGEGYFEISVSERVYDKSSLKFYARNKKDFTKNKVKISPWDLKVSTYYIEGKYNKDTNIKVYYKSRFVGEGRSNKDGKFRIKSNERILNQEDLTFYSTDNSMDSKNISIISAAAGDTKITGTSSAFAEIIVKDSDNIRLGNTKSDKDGNFTVFLNRALKNGEVITFTINESNRDEISSDYTVSGLQSANLNRIAYVKGYPNGNFKAGANISRAEAVMMMSRLMNNSSNFNTAKTTKFEDAKDGWYAQAINFAVDKKVINGYPNGDFEPDSYITRAEFAAMVSKYVGINNKSASGLKDIDNHWAKEAIAALYGNKMIKGYPDGTFKPQENITRAEAVTVLNAAFGRKSDINSINNLANKKMLVTFNDVKKSDWYYAEVLDAANNHNSYMKGDAEIWTDVK